MIPPYMYPQRYSQKYVIKNLSKVVVQIVQLNDEVHLQPIRQISLPPLIKVRVNFLRDDNDAVPLGIVTK